MLSSASRICCVGTWRRFSHLRLPLKCPNWISSVSIAPNRVSKLKLAISSRLTPISWRHSSNRPTQSLKVPIFATLPGMSSTPRYHRVHGVSQRKPHRETPSFLCVPLCPLWLLLSNHAQPNRFHFRVILDCVRTQFSSEARRLISA